MMSTITGEIAIALERFENRASDIERDMVRLTQDMQARGAESTKVFSEVRDQIRLQGQEIAHLKSVTFPAYWENEINVLKDLIYKLQCEVREEVSFWRKFREEKYFEAVSYEEMIQFVKMADIKLKQIAAEINMDISSVSRILNGEKRKDDFPLYHKIKMLCVQELKRNAGVKGSAV